MNFADLRREQIRLATTQLLAKAPGYQANDGELSRALRLFGLDLSHDDLRIQLAWLNEHGLISVTTISDTVQVAKLTARGEDAAYGRTIIPGIKRPGPEDSI